MPSAAIGCVRGDAKGRIIRFLRVDMGIGLHKFDEELFHRVCETAISIIEPRLSCEISVVAIKLAEFCSGRGIVGLPLLIMLILITSLVNLFLVSSTSKWALLAPIFIPFMYYLGYSAEGAQVVYRIGDSCTNIITPLQPFIAMHLAVIRKYDADAGLGSIFSRTLPLSMTFFVTWVILLAIWYITGLPLGPGGIGFTL